MNGMLTLHAQLTYLLQNSLSGNSKTLVSTRLLRRGRGVRRSTDILEQMFLNLSPLAAHLNESLCSLRFATKASIQTNPKWWGVNALLILFVEQVNNTQIGTAKKQVKSTS
jgi:kinesin family protein C1